jgi:hypothetical protein
MAGMKKFLHILVETLMLFTRKTENDFPGVSKKIPEKLK